MRQARPQEHSLLRLPPALPPRHQAQGLFVLTEARCKHRSTVVGLGESPGIQVGQGRHQPRLLYPPWSLGVRIIHCRVARQKRWGCRTVAISRRGSTSAATAPGPDGAAVPGHCG
jgi:hypothetical protein